MAVLALIGLGSNVGDRKAHLDLAVAALTETPGVTVRGVSSYHETKPAGGPAGQGSFLNAATSLETTLDPVGLLHELLSIEARAGRVRTVRWGERPLDLDLLIYGCTSLKTPELTLPHPRLGVRRFVLAPLAEIAPKFVDLRSGLSIESLLANIDRRPGYIALDGAPGPLRDAIFDGIVAGLSAAGLAEYTIPPGAGPDWIESDPLLRSILSPSIRARIKALDAELWRKNLRPWEWLVSDFCLTSRGHVELDRWSDGTALDIHAMRRLAAKRPSPQERLRSWLLPPTFLVALPGGSYATKNQLRGRPFRTLDVLLTPEATEPEVIIDEVLAACNASRA